MSLSSWLIENNVSVTGMAKAINVNRTTLSLVAGGNRKPGKILIDKIETYTKNGVSREQLLQDCENSQYIKNNDTIHTSLKELSVLTRKLMNLSRSLRKKQVDNLTKAISNLLSKYDKS